MKLVFMVFNGRIGPRFDTGHRYLMLDTQTRWKCRDI